MQGKAARKEGFTYAENLSAQEASQEEGAWLPEKDVRQERTQGACAPQGKRQSASFLLNSSRAARAGGFAPLSGKFQKQSIWRARGIPRRLSLMPLKATLVWPFFSLRPFPRRRGRGFRPEKPRASVSRRPPHPKWRFLWKRFSPSRATMISAGHIKKGRAMCPPC